MPLKLAEEKEDDGMLKKTCRVLELRDWQQTFIFVDVAEEPVLSSLRNLPASIKIISLSLSDKQLIFLMLHDRCSVNRWYAGQKLIKRLFLARLNDICVDEAGSEAEKVIWKAFKKNIAR